MRRPVSAFFAILLVATACGGGDSDADSTLPSFPPVVVNDWLVAVAEGDADAMTATVYQESLTLVIAIENGLDAPQTATMLEDGLDPAYAVSYWQSFRDEFAQFSGGSLEMLEVGRYEILAVDDIAFASVEVGGAEERTEMMTRSDDALGWQVDMLATVGPAFAAQLRRLAEELPAGPAGDRVRAALRASALPALRAAATRDPGNRILTADIERLQVILDQAAATSTTTSEG
jgi:hypothetical protein